MVYYCMSPRAGRLLGCPNRRDGRSLRAGRWLARVSKSSGTGSTVRV